MLCVVRVTRAIRDPTRCKKFSASGIIVTAENSLLYNLMVNAEYSHCRQHVHDGSGEINA